MSALENEVQELRRQLEALAERVRLSATAERFIQGKHEVREKDFFLYNGSFPTQLSNLSSEQKWTFVHPDGRYCEPFRIPNDGSREGEVNALRLYTIEEVAEIVAKVSNAERAADEERAGAYRAWCEAHSEYVGVTDHMSVIKFRAWWSDFRQRGLLRAGYPGNAELRALEEAYEAHPNLRSKKS